MKKILFALFVAIFVFSTCACAGEEASAEPHKYYALSTVVREVNTDDDVVVCEDTRGDVWIFYGAEDWQVGDVCSMVMDDMGTALVEDDEIVSCRFGGLAMVR